MLYLNNSGETPEKRNSQLLIKEKNIKWLFDLINEQSGITRARLVRITKLSPTTVSSLIEELVNNSLVIETGKEALSASGRRPIKLKVSKDGGQIPVFSLNRWGIRYTLYDLEFNELETHFVPHMSDRYGGFEESESVVEPSANDDYANLIYGVFKEQAQKIIPQKVLAICVSFPGIWIETSKAFTSSAMHVSFSGSSMAQLKERMGAPVFIGNSSMCLAYAEKKFMDKAGKIVDDLMYVNICDGVGSGIIYRGEIFTGPQHSAGEIGHISIDYAGRRCSCGNRGCLEQYVSTDAILRTVKKAVSEQQCTEILDMAHDSYDNITLGMIGEAYEMGVPVIKAVMDDIAEKLFAGLHSSICITNIKQIVLGGGIEQLGKGFLQRLRSRFAQKMLPIFSEDVTVTYTNLGFKGDSIGIAEYYVDKVFYISS